MKKKLKTLIFFTKAIKSGEGLQKYLEPLTKYFAGSGTETKFS